MRGSAISGAVRPLPTSARQQVAKPAYPSPARERVGKVWKGFLQILPVPAQAGTGRIFTFPTTPDLCLTQAMPESNSASPARWPAYARVPPFLPVPLRARADGWSEERQAAFIGLLAETGCVAEAARRVGLSRVAAYQLRRRTGAESFAHAWDAVLAIRAGSSSGARRNFTPGELAEAALAGPVTVRMRRGKFRSARREPSDFALLRCLARIDAGRRLAGIGAAAGVRRRAR